MHPRRAAIRAMNDRHLVRTGVHPCLPRFPRRRNSCSRWKRDARLSLCTYHAAPYPSRRKGTLRNDEAQNQQPGIGELFRGGHRKITTRMNVLRHFLTAHWAFMFWYLQQLRNLPDVRRTAAEP